MASGRIQIAEIFCLFCLFLLDSVLSAAIREDLVTPLGSLKTLSQSQIQKEIKQKKWAETR